jgi:hypothetical protein
VLEIKPYLNIGTDGVNITNLRLEILKCLACDGKLSKGMAEQILQKHTHTTRTNHQRVKHHHPEIVAAFNYLRSNELISELNTNPGPGLVYGRGRPRRYFEITEKGLKQLITQDANPAQFWKCIIGYCYHNDLNVSGEKLEEFLQLFIQSHFKFPRHGFSFQFDIFNRMRIKWLKDFVLLKRISPEQKVLEVLAIHPNITFEKLVQKTGENKSNIGSVLSTYTLESYKPLVIKNEYYIDQSIIGKKHNRKYWDFLLHNSVIIIQNRQGIMTYELSLFGIILVLTLVRFHDMGKLNHRLYYGEISFSNYYDIIAANYETKLPLIFGKWILLKKVLNVDAAYNFDILLDDDLMRRSSDNLSILSGGNKEFFDGIREIVLQTGRQLRAFADSGTMVGLGYASGTSYEDFTRKSGDGDSNDSIKSRQRSELQKVRVVYEKLKELMRLLDPIESISSKSVNLNAEDLRQLPFVFEKQFADEISALYYFHLFYDHGVITRMSQPAKYYPSFKHNQSAMLSSPKEYLSSIIQSDKNEPLIGKWFYKWMEDIGNLQKEIYGTFVSNVKHMNSQLPSTYTNV